MSDKNLKRTPLSRAKLIRVRPPHRPKRPRFFCVLTGRHEENFNQVLVDPPAEFDWVVYEKAKPHFRKVWEHYSSTGKSLKDFVEVFIKLFSCNIKPYLKQFLMDARDGKLYDQTGEGKQRSMLTTDEEDSTVLPQDRPAPQPQGRIRIKSEAPPLLPDTELTPEQKEF